eukprot:scaffold17615_cov107-Isochrysis_galbana.AAC.2
MTLRLRPWWALASAPPCVHLRRAARAASTMTLVAVSRGVAVILCVDPPCGLPPPAGCAAEGPAAHLVGRLRPDYL